MVDQLEQAVAMSFGPLEKLFKKTDLDVDSLIAKVRGAYSGQGGPLGAAGGGQHALVRRRRAQRPLRQADARPRPDEPDADRREQGAPTRCRCTATSASPAASASRDWGRMHAGVDLAAPRGTPIFATADGVVVAAGPESGYGNVVRVQHEFGFETVYAHQSRIRVKVGQQVSRGVQIGDMGSTGRSTGSHLHYEVRVNGQPVNPMTYLEAAKDVF